MKKICLLLLLPLLFLVGCETNQTPTTDDTQTKINSAKLYVSDNIPLAVSNDLVLPSISGKNAVQVTWSCDVSTITNNTWIFLEQPTAYTVTLKATYTYKEKVEVVFYSFVASATIIDENLVKLEDTKADIISGLPFMTNGNIDFRNLYTEEDAVVIYNVDHSYITHGLWIYDFPETDYTLKVTVNITVNDQQTSFTQNIGVQNVTKATTLPHIYLTTENSTPITSKEDYLTGTFSLETETDHLENATMSVKGRGNSTWDMPKKAYRVKFDEKTSLFGMDKASDWVLLANYADRSLMRNYLAYMLAGELSNLDFSPTTHMVDLTVNGEYLGTYLLTDQMEVGSSRVDITEKITDVNTGYLIELDKRLYEVPEGTNGWDWFVVYGIPYAIKSPKTDKSYYSIDQFNYIKNYVQLTQDALAAKSNYDDYLDVASAIDFFIVNELFKNVDVGYSSCYLHKDTDGLLKYGPVWDFDLSSGAQGHLQEWERTVEGWYGCRSDKNYWFYLLMQDTNFKKLFKERYVALYQSVIIPTIEKIYDLYNEIYYSSYTNFQKWDILGEYYNQWYEVESLNELETYEEQVFFLYDYLTARAKWLYDEVSKF